MAGSNASRVELHTTINQLDTTDYTCSLCCPTAEHMFSSSCGTFTKMDHTLDPKTHLNKLKRIEIIQCLLLDHSGIKLEITER